MTLKLGGTPKWFPTSLRDQMFFEIKVVKSRKLAPPHYVLKSESDEIVKKKKQIQANQMVLIFHLS